MIRIGESIGTSFSKMYNRACLWNKMRCDETNSFLGGELWSACYVSVAFTVFYLGCLFLEGVGIVKSSIYSNVVPIVM